MIRNAIAVVAVFAFTSGLFADEIKAKLVKVDSEKGTITALVGAKKGEKGEEKTFKVAKDAKFKSVKAGAKKGDAPTIEDITDGLKNAAFTVSGKGGPNVTITTKGEGDKAEAVEISVNIGGKKKKDK